MEDIEDNSVPEFNAASPDAGAERLDPDPITQDLDAQIDTMLDEAETNSGEEAGDSSAQESDPAYSRDTAPAPEQPVPQQQPARSNIDPEIAAIEQPRNLSEKNQSNWRKLQETASNYKRQAMEAQILRQQLQQREQQQELPADYEELRKFRQIFDIKNDPEFKTKYDGQINSAKDSVYNILRKNGAPDEVIKSIEAAGGPDKVDQNWWKKNAIDRLPMLDAEMLKKSLVDVVSLKDAQEREIQHAAENADQFMAQRQEQTKNWYHNETGAIEQYVDQMTQNVPWARFQQIPENATQEQIQRIQEHNKSVYGLKQKFDSALWPTTAEDRTNVAAAAVFSHVLTNQLRIEQKMRADMQAQIKRLTAENNSYKGASKVPRPGAKSTSNTRQNTTADRLKMSSADAIDMGLDEASE